MNSELKSHFEANMLDGDKLDDCGKAMLSAESVYEYLEEIVEAREQKLLRRVKKEVMPKEREWDTAEPYDNPDIAQGHNEAVGEMNEALSNLLEEIIDRSKE